MPFCAPTTRPTPRSSGGWLRGRDLVAQGVTDDSVNRVILLTDGLANCGITDPDKLVGLCGSGSESRISTTTVGFGEGFDEDLLKAMADAGQGGTYYVEEADQAVGIFEEELDGLQSLVAQNVRVELEPGTDAEFVRVLHEYPSHSEGDALTLEVGDVYAREPRRIIMVFSLGPDAGVGEDAKVANVTVTAHVLTAEGRVELRTISLPITLSPEEGGKVEPEVRREGLCSWRSLEPARPHSKPTGVGTGIVAIRSWPKLPSRPGRWASTTWSCVRRSLTSA